MLRIIKAELHKTFLRGRTYIGFIAVAIIVLGVELAVWLEGSKMLDFITLDLQRHFILEGQLINGYFTTYVVLNSLWVHVPILVALVAGDMLAGEAAAGTFRLILTRTASRTQIVMAKFLAALAYVYLLVALMAALSLGLGMALFGTGDLVVVKKTINMIPPNDVIWRFAGAFLFGALSMTTVAALSLFYSSLADNSIGPILGCAATIIVLTIFSTLNFGFFRIIRPFLFTTHMSGWRLFFDYEPNLWVIGRSSAILFGHVVLFLLLALWHFNKKDILS
ncbi:MAG: ABC transporter permease [Flavobacteriales bacterium]|nr:ABC transporter permease [Flavobacteriales bacterium]